mmetsp:Transcript_42358/g.112084  ORF Transcript_42358/g.112084 Transcript_42358/m.112084 type:complete len:347 (+) Transcript_42358:268-1308(+)
MVRAGLPGLPELGRLDADALLALLRHQVELADRRDHAGGDQGCRLHPPAGLGRHLEQGVCRPAGGAQDGSPRGPLPAAEQHAARGRVAPGGARVRGAVPAEDTVHGGAERGPVAEVAVADALGIAGPAHGRGCNGRALPAVVVRPGCGPRQVGRLPGPRGSSARVPHLGPRRGLLREAAERLDGVSVDAKPPAGPVLDSHGRGDAGGERAGPGDRGPFPWLHSCGVALHCEQCTGRPADRRRHQVCGQHTEKLLHGPVHPADNSHVVYTVRQPRERPFCRRHWHGDLRGVPLCRTGPAGFPPQPVLQGEPVVARRHAGFCLPVALPVRPFCFSGCTSGVLATRLHQ